MRPYVTKTAAAVTLARAQTARTGARDGRASCRSRTTGPHAPVAGAWAACLRRAAIVAIGPP